VTISGPSSNDDSPGNAFLTTHLWRASAWPPTTPATSLAAYNARFFNGNLQYFALDTSFTFPHGTSEKLASILSFPDTFPFFVLPLLETRDQDNAAPTSDLGVLTRSGRSIR